MRYFAGAPFIGTGIDSWFQVKSASENQFHSRIRIFAHQPLMHNTQNEKTLITEKLPQYSEVKRFTSHKAKKTLIIYSKQ